VTLLFIAEAEGKIVIFVLPSGKRIFDRLDPKAIRKIHMDEFDSIFKASWDIQLWRKVDVPR
jgi:hypothetical protein